ncbi:MAG: maltotransferase domain-containing protein [Verrucomicrobiota bacterium]
MPLGKKPSPPSTAPSADNGGPPSPPKKTAAPTSNPQPNPRSKGKPFARSTPRPHAPTTVIANISPNLDNGRYAIKRVAGEDLFVQADIFKDGHDTLRALLKWRAHGADSWNESPMHPIENDRWTGVCQFEGIGKYEFSIEAWADPWQTWLHEFEKKFEAKQKDLSVEITEGAFLVVAAGRRALADQQTDPAQELSQIADAFRTATPEKVNELLQQHELIAMMERWPDRSLSTSLDHPLPVDVERARARFSAWYEFFPRSAQGLGDRSSTFRDCLPRIEDAKAMGFDIVYFPPIHPIGVTARKGKNGALHAQPGEPGSPWAIGSAAGGHFAVEPSLGTIEDFEWLVQETRNRGLEIALDFAINCSPDHPYVKEHPDWFFKRPDGSIKYAENPPKKYQDIYPLNFHCEDWRNLWKELARIVFFWISKGVRIFRVDNPHTKPFAFWEYLIREVKSRYPDVLFLAEAFTRPRLMEMLGKIGFTQSYSYFTWRVSKQELTEYANELTQTERRFYFRANFWPNTPDILAIPLQWAGPNQFKIRATLAATLSSSWGMYSGYELCENEPHPDREEYNDNEKFQFKSRDWNAPGNIKPHISRLNQIRRDNPALQEYDNLQILSSGNDQILAYAKTTSDLENIIVVIVNLDESNRQDSDVHLPLTELGLPNNDCSFTVHDLLNEEVYQWHGPVNYVSLDPQFKTAHILRIQTSSP